MSIESLTALQLSRQVALGQIKSTEATQAVLNLISRYNESLGVFLSVWPDQALEKAAAVDERISRGEPVGKLAGVPIALKDNMCSRMGKTTCASKILENFRAPYDAHVVEKLEAAGAIIVGKCNMDEFAMGSSTENSGLQQTLNPWDTSRVPGGSSGGSAAAVAARMCYAALGSDTGGSIRQPASFCGVVGLKPTYGRVSRYGLVAYGSSLDQIGPLTRTVGDAALMLQVIAGHDHRDSTSVSQEQAPVGNYLAQLDEPLEGLKVGIPKEFFEVEGLNDEVAQSVQGAIDAYKKMGAELIEVHLPHIKYSVATYYLVATAEASSNLARYDGVHYGHRTAKPKDYVDVYSSSREEGFGAEVKRRIMLGTYALSSGYYDAYYLKSLKVRNLIRQDFNTAFEQVDCLMGPTAPEVAFKIGDKMDDPLKMYLSDIYTIAVNLAGLPAMSIPCGLDGENLPIGLQIITPTFTEEKLLRIGRMFEVATNYSSIPPGSGSKTAD